MYLENWCGIDSCAPKANILEAKLQIRSTPQTFWIGFWTIFYSSSRQIIPSF